MQTVATMKFQDIAAKDLNSLNELLLHAHPGTAPSAADSKFMQWMELGTREAMAETQDVESEEDVAAVVQRYLAGFQDPHLHAIVSGKNHKTYWTGFLLKLSKGDAIVVERESLWSVPLPPVGAKLRRCDGIEASLFIHTRIAPYLDRRENLAATRANLATYVTVASNVHPMKHTGRARQCEFELTNGKLESYLLRWEMSGRGVGTAAQAAKRKSLSTRLFSNNILWVEASDFSASPSNMKAMESMRTTLVDASHLRAVVIDLRGNGGGDSMVGREILRALLKQQMPEVEAPLARWRTSTFALTSLRRHFHRFLELEGANGDSSKFLAELISSMEAAEASAAPWTDDRLMPADSENSLPGIPFSGKVLLLTDHRCQSACLSFMDMALAAANAIHVGHVTDADSQYNDIAVAALPSGLNVSIPLKKYIDRKRKPNQPHVPKIVFDGDIDDDTAVEMWILSLLDRGRV